MKALKGVNLMVIIIIIISLLAICLNFSYPETRFEKFNNPKVQSKNNQSEKIKIPQYFDEILKDKTNNLLIGKDNYSQNLDLDKIDIKLNTLDKMIRSLTNPHFQKPITSASINPNSMFAYENDHF